MYVQVPIEISKQGDELWRVEATGLKGCWVDAPTLQQALNEIQEVIVMVIDLYKEKGWPLPDEVKSTADLPMRVSIPVAVEEIEFKRLSKTASGKSSR